jgi:nucleotide-binding universal stress UspA family protein
MDPFPMTVLFAPDGSKEAEPASHMAAATAKRTESELHIVCVVDLGAAADPRLRERLRQRARGLLDDRAKKMSESGSAVAGTHVRIGRPDREMVAHAEKRGAGLIVMGSCSLGGMRWALMGSASGSVVRHAHRPVMVVRPEKERTEQQTRVEARPRSRALGRGCHSPAPPRLYIVIQRSAGKVFLGSLYPGSCM